jgi:hypothetical protein
LGEEDKMFGMKKEKKDTTNTTSTKTNTAEYKVVIKEKFSKGTTTLKEITARREIDLDDYVVYLSNVGENFLELMPQDENDFEQLNAKEIETKLKAAKDALKKNKTAEDKGTNEQNFLYEVMKLEAKKRALKYNAESSYITLDAKGVKTFYYLREGSTFYPFKWDVDNRTVYVANENVKKKAGMARRNKSIKYSKFKNVIEGSVMFMMIVNVILALGLGYTGMKMFTKFDESKIVEAQNFCLMKGAEWTAITEKNAKASEEIFKNLQQATGVTNPFLEAIVPVEVGGGSTQ